MEAYQLIFPQSEAEKINPVRLPAEILAELLENVKGDLNRRFNAVMTK